MSNLNRLSRRTATQFVNSRSANHSASATYLPRAMRRGRQRQSQVNALASSGNVVKFSNANGYVNINYDGSAVTTDHATFEVWLKTTGSGQQMIFNGANVAPFVIIENDQILAYWAGASPDQGWLSADTRPITDGQWHHIAVVFNAGTIRFYKDGIATADSFTVSGPATANGQVNIGLAFAGAAGFVGQLYGARIWSVARTAQQIQVGLSTTVVGNEPGLQLATAFDAATNAVTNQVGNGAGSIVGAAAKWDYLPAGPTFAFYSPGGAADYGSCGTLSFTVGSNSSTFECWMKMSTTAGVSATPQTILLCNNPGVANPRIEYDGGDKLGVTWNDQHVNSADTTPISDGEWHHIAVVFDQNQVVFYKDGLPTNEALTLSGDLQVSGATFQLGPAVFGTSPFHGQITDARVWNVPRTPADIQSNLYTTFTGKEPGLVMLDNFSYCDPAVPAGWVLRNQVLGYAGGVSGNAAVVPVVGPQQPMPTNVWAYPITGVAPQGPVITAQGLLYAENVAAQGNTPAGNYLRSLDVQTNALNWTYSVHDNSNIPTPVIPAALSAANGVAYVGAQATDASGNSFVELHAVNGSTGQSVWPIPAQFTALSVATKPVAGGGVVVIGAIYVNPDTLENEAAVFWTDVATGKNVNSFTGIGGVANFMLDPIIKDGVAYFGVGYGDGDAQSLSFVVALNLSTAAMNWFRNPLHFSSGGIALGNSMIYCTCHDGAVVALNIADGSIAWTRIMSNQPITVKPVVIGTTVYVGSSDGILYALDGSTGDELWRVNTQSPIITDLMMEDGVLYFANQGDGTSLSPAFYSIDSASLGNDVLEYPVPDADTILFTQGTSNGVVYFYGKQTLYAVNMDTIIHEFNVDTKLIVENYDTSNPSNGAQPNDTSYRVTLALNDPLKMPRIRQAVKVWASDTLHLSNRTDANGNPVQIGPTQPYWVETDASGKVTLAFSAYDDGVPGGSSSSAPNVTCPALYAWANFMMPGEAIVIYPDHEHLGKLAALQGQSTTAAKHVGATDDTLYLNTATGYDGQPLILSQYQDSASLTAIASTIRNTIGTRNSSSVSIASARVVRAMPASGNKYIAFPDAMPNVNYQSDNTQSAARAFAPGSDPIWTMDMSGSAPVYQQSYDDTRPANLPPPANQYPSSVSIRMINGVQHITSIKDFFHNVIKGAEKVAKLAWQWTQNAVSTVIHTAESIYTLTITSLEDAVTAVVGFFKSVVADIKKVIQWLSALFDWGNILTNHTLIKSYVTNSNQTGMLDRMQAWVTAQIALLNNNQPSDIDTVYGTLSGNGQSSVGNSATNLGGQTVQTTQGPNSNPNDVYNYGGQNNATQSQWMQQKVGENNIDASTGAMIEVAKPRNRYHFYMPWIANQGTPGAAPTSPTEAATPDAPQQNANLGAPITGDIEQAYDTFIGTILSSIANDFKDFPDQLQAQLGQMQDRLKDPKSILGNGLADILAVFKVLADDMINLGKAIAVAFLQFLNSLLSVLADWLTTTINIPFVSALYKAITRGDDLTMLDLVALMVAVPATILMKAMSGSATPSAAVATQVAAGVLVTDSPDIDGLKLFLGIISTLVSMGASVFDAILFAIEVPFNGKGPGTPLQLPSALDLAADTLEWVLGMTASFAWNAWQAHDWIFWAIQSWPQLMSLVFTFKSSTQFQQVGRDTAYGVVLLLAASIYAYYWPSSYRDAPKAPGLVISANVFSSLNYMVEVIYNGFDLGPVVATIGKIVCGNVSAILDFTSFVLGLVNSSAQDQHAVPLNTSNRPLTFMAA